MYESRLCVHLCIISRFAFRLPAPLFNVNSDLAIVRATPLVHLLRRELGLVLAEPLLGVLVSCMTAEGTVPRGWCVLHTVAVGAVNVLAVCPYFQSLEPSLLAVGVNTKPWVVCGEVGQRAHRAE